MKKDVLNKQLGLRVPEELVKRLHVKAAEETIKRKQKISLNDLCVEVLMKAVGMVEKKKEGK